jgi:outer membrane protein
MKKRLALLIFLGAPLWAQAPLSLPGALEPLSLKDAVRLAMVKNQVVAASDAGEHEAASKIAEARSGFFPKVSYTESWARSDNPVFVFSSLLTQHQFLEQNFQLGPLNRPDALNNFTSRVIADQPVYDAGKTRRGIRSMGLEMDIAAETTRRMRMEVIAAVVRSYCDAVLGADQLSVSVQALRSAEADLTRAEAHRAAGMSTDVDVLSIRVHLAAVREQQIQRSADFDVSRAALNDAMGVPLDSLHALTTPLSLAAVTGGSAEQYEASGLASRPEARQLQLAARLAETKQADARSQYLPEVGLHAVFEADRQRVYDRGGANWLASVELRWNLFNGFGDKSRIAESTFALRRATADQERAASAIRLQVRRNLADLRAAQQRIEVAGAAVAEAEESLRITQNRYDAGISTVTDLLRTESAVLEARTRRLAAIHDQRIAAAMLEMAAGTLNPDSEVLN